MSPTRAPRARSTSVAKAAKAGQGSRTAWIIGSVAVIVVLAGAMAFALSQEEGTGETRARQLASVTVTGEPLPLYAQGVPFDPAPAPELSGTSLDGTPMSISNDGRPKVIGFFTHWCQFCQAEVPEVSEWYNAGNAPDDVDIVAVSTDVDPMRPNYPPSAWFERESWAVPTLLDDAGDPAATAFGLSGFPFWAVVDADGTVLARQSGQIGIDQLENLIDLARNGA